ncbi:unnamed protein product [Arctogadus glacialis]
MSVAQYPASAKQFIHSGLKGEWDRKKAGLRMKLEQPVTWERLLSQQGNKAATWEQLIDIYRGDAFLGAWRQNLKDFAKSGSLMDSKIDLLFPDSAIGLLALTQPTKNSLRVCQ